MATTQEILEVLYRYKGEEEHKRLNQDLQNELQWLVELDRQLRAGSVSQAVYDADVAKATAKVGQLIDAQRQLDAAMKQLGGGTAASGRGLLQLGYLADDAKQFFTGPDGLVQGMRAVGNNIPGLVMSLGGTAGLAGGIALVSTAAAIAVPALVKLVTSLTTSDVNRFNSELTQTAARIEELKDADLTIAVNTFELDVAQAKLAKLQAGYKAFDDLVNLKSRTEAQSGQDVRELVAEVPGGAKALGDKIAAQLIKAIEADPGSKIGQARAETEAARANLEDVTINQKSSVARFLARRRVTQAEQAEQTAQLEAGNAVRGEVGGLFDESFKGDVNAQRKLAGLVRGAGQGRLAEDIVASSPAEQAAAEQDEREEEAAQRGHERAKAARKRREQTAKKAADADDQEAKDEEAFTDVDQRESDRRLAARKAREKAAARANEAEVKRDREKDAKDLEEATKPFAAEAELAIFQGARGKFASPQFRAQFQQQTSTQIRRAAEANLLAGGESPERAKELAQRAPQAVSEGLQRKNLALQAKGLSVAEAGLALQQQLVAAYAQADARLAQVEQRQRALLGQFQGVVRTSQNRAR